LGLALCYDDRAVGVCLGGSGSELSSIFALLSFPLPLLPFLSLCPPPSLFCLDGAGTFILGLALCYDDRAPVGPFICPWLVINALPHLISTLGVLERPNFADSAPGAEDSVKEEGTGAEEAGLAAEGWVVVLSPGICSPELIK